VRGFGFFSELVKRRDSEVFTQQLTPNLTGRDNAVSFAVIAAGFLEKKPLREQRLLNLGGCLQIMLHAVIGCFELTVATGQAMFETQDAFSGAQPSVKLAGVKGLGTKSSAPASMPSTTSSF